MNTFVNTKVTVHFVSGIPSQEFDISEFDSTFQGLRQKCLEYVHEKITKSEFNAPMFVEAFGIVALPKEEIWLPQWYIFDPKDMKNTEYKFRVRHRPPLSCYREDDILGQYLFLQLKDDFNKGPLGKIPTTEMSRKLFLLPTSLFLPDSLPFDENKIVNNDYKSPALTVFNYGHFLSKEIKKSMCPAPFVDKIFLFLKLKQIFKRRKHQNFPISTFMCEFYEFILKEEPEYCFESYEALNTDVNPPSQVTVRLRLYTEETNVIAGLYYGENFQCSLEDIQSMTLKQPDSMVNRVWHVFINILRKDQQTLSFKEEGAAESFISSVQGYVQLCLCYHACLVSNISNLNSRKLARDLRSFGPLCEETIKQRLVPDEDANERDKKFLICESPKRFNCYLVTIVKPSFSNGFAFGHEHDIFQDFEVECEDGGRLRLLDGADGSEYGNATELRRHLRENYGHQILPRHYYNKEQDVAEVNKWFKSMHIEYYASDNYAINNNTEEPELDTAGIYMREDVIDARRIEDKNPYMRKDLVDVKIGRRIISLVRVGLIEHCQIEIVRAFGHAQEQNVKLERKSEVRPNNFLRLCGTFINHPSVLVEHAPCGDLLTFLSRRPQRLAVKVDIMLQIVGVLSVMEKHNLFHGNIRCRRFVVFENESTSSYHIKLGDAGVSSFLDGLPVDSEHNLERLPWLAPERRIKENGKFPEPTFETECYAVGTAFYEILCGDDNFETQIENLENNQLKLVSEFLQAKNILPKPVLLQLPADSEEAPSPEVRHAMEEIYKLVKLCWSEDPNDRPSTSDLRSQLDELSEDVDNIQNETQSQVLRRIMYDAGNDEPQVTRVTEDRICEFVNSHRTMMLHMKHVHVGDKIGHGFYGEVFDGEIDVPRMFLSAEQEKKRVAIKKLKAGPRDGSFIKEIMTATGLDDPNIVKVLYCSYNPRGHLSDINMLIMEYMNKGSLSSYLETERPRPKTSDLMKIIEDIVKGMVYLAGKNIVHRDLAARNILLSWDESLKILTAKVSDFGLSRRMEKDTQHYRLKKGEKLPVFWMPPEQHQFTTKGDVWSFGVVMWETMTYGCHPRDCDIKNPRMQQDVFAAKVDKGWRLPQKFKLDGQYKSIEEDIYGVMGKCWSKLPEDRPFFVDIKNEIETIHQHYVLKASHSTN